MNTNDSTGKQNGLPDDDGQEIVPVISADGSHTLYCLRFNQHYHSTFGAITESEHIFIRSGLSHYIKISSPLSHESRSPVRILEAGFGTGLNAFLTQRFAEKQRIHIDYTSLEAFPVDARLSSLLNYPEMTGGEGDAGVFSAMHLAPWDHKVKISDHFSLLKKQMRFEAFEPAAFGYEVVYFDAFDPSAQPGLWTSEVLGKMAQSLVPGGIVITYSVQGHVVRLLKSLGFCVEKLAGPPGKRHILRAEAIGRQK